MQKHEGPPRDHKKEERARQRNLTRGLMLVIVVLAAAIAGTLLKRFG